VANNSLPQWLAERQPKRRSVQRQSRRPFRLSCRGDGGHAPRKVLIGKSAGRARERA
jgi:hypothetical protein